MAHKSSESRIEEQLLRRIFSDPLDHGYEQLAEVNTTGTRMSLGGKIFTVLLTTFMVALTIFAVKDLTDRSNELDTLSPLRSEVNQSRSDLFKIEQTNRDLAAQIKELGSAFTATQTESNEEQDGEVILGKISGPGVSVVASDASLIDPKDPEAYSKRVQDRDLQTIINQLWASGAEAVSVNDIRLGPQTAIRAAGGAILVDLKPISSPYTLTAIGDQNELVKGLSTGSTADFLSLLQTRYGISISFKKESKLLLKSASYQSYKTAKIEKP